MLKLIFVIVAVVAAEKVSGGGDSVCTVPQVARDITEAYFTSVASTKSSCFSGLQDVFNADKQQGVAKDDFRSSIANQLSSCTNTINVVSNNFVSSLAGALAVTSGQLKAIVEGGSYAPPISCIASLHLSTMGNFKKAQSNLTDKVSELTGRY